MLTEQEFEEYEERTQKLAMSVRLLPIEGITEENGTVMRRYSAGEE